ncbi:MAG: carboxymuconolactone decarboxylase family protein [Planctomycetota bacterium]
MDHGGQRDPHFGGPGNENMMALMISKKSIFAPMGEVCDQIMRSKGELSPAEREVIAAYVSKLSECEFCELSHASIAKELGFNDVEKVLQGEAGGMETLFVFAKKVAQGLATREDIEIVMSNGYSEAVAQEVVLITALFGFFNRLVEGYGFSAPPEHYPQVGRMMRDSYRAVTPA